MENNLIILNRLRDTVQELCGATMPGHTWKTVIRVKSNKDQRVADICSRCYVWCKQTDNYDYYEHEASKSDLKNYEHYLDLEIK